MDCRWVIVAPEQLKIYMPRTVLIEASVHRRDFPNRMAGLYPTRLFPDRE